MQTSPSTHVLNGEQIEQASAMLQKERHANMPSKRAAKIYKVFDKLFYIYGIFVIFSSVFDFVFDFISERTSSILIVAYGILGGVLGLTVLVLFLINLPFFLRILRQYKLMRRLGLLDAVRAPLKMQWRENRFRTMLDFVPRIVPAVIWVFSFVLNFLRVSDPQILVVMISLLLGIPLTICPTMVYFMHRHVQLASSLYSSLQGYKSKLVENEENQVQISPHDYEAFAKIERAQISRERAESIMLFLQESQESYALQKSCEAQEAQSKLDATTRLRVQNRIDALCADPRPPGVTEDRDTGTLRVAVPGTPAIIGFTVNDQRRLIQIVFIHAAEDGAEAVGQSYE